MTTTIGRAQGLREMSVTYDGDSITISGYAMPATNNLAAVIATRQQILGLINNVDEPVVPVTCTNEPAIDGFYIVQSASANYLRGAGTFNMVGFSVTMTRIENYGSAIFEVRAQFVAQPNALSLPVTASAGTTGIPATARGFDGPVTAVLPVVASDANSFSTYGMQIVTLGVTPNTSRTWRFTIPPSEYYNSGNCSIEVSRNSVYYPLMGRQLDNGSTTWRITNGLIRASMKVVSSKVTLEIDTVDQQTAGWNERDYTFTLPAASGALSPDVLGTASVLRNSPEQVTIRVTLGFSAGNSANYPLVYLDMTLRRGQRMIACNLVSTFSGRPIVACSVTTALTATSGGGGYVSTSGDTQHAKVVMGTTVAHTSSNTTTGQIEPDSNALSFPFTLGTFYTDEGFVGANTARDMIDGWVNYITEVQRVVAR